MPARAAIASIYSLVGGTRSRADIDIRQWGRGRSALGLPVSMHDNGNASLIGVGRSIIGQDIHAGCDRRVLFKHEYLNPEIDP